MTTGRWNRVTVVGCGLIGASFALAMKQTGACTRLAGWDASASVIDEALKSGVIEEVDRSFMNGEVSSSDLVYLAMPVGEIIAFLRERGPQIKPGALVTDAGSTKQEVCRAAREQFSKAWRFIGGHPIAGSHRRGLAHARADLFNAAPYVLVSGENQDEDPALMALQETLDLFGARVTLMTASEHDRAMAQISHLPQLVASALAATIKEQPEAAALINLAGPGYGDMTRLAGSSWSMWRDILATNSTPVAVALELLIEKLAAVRDELRDYSERTEHGLSKARALFEKS